MSSDQEAVADHRFSTVVPGDVTGSAVVHELTGMDLIMKLHYLRAVYYFAPSEVVDGLGIMELKKPMFPWLNVYYPLAGRIRRAAEGGRPFIKCNDCGLRIVEASCGRTLEEWLHADQEGATTRWRSLVPDKVLGPELHFSPLVYIQFTRFKHGGMAIGYSWAHVLGDPESATNSINLWGELLSGKPRTAALPLIKQPQNHGQNTEELAAAPQEPAPIKQVEIADDVWLPPTPRKMATRCFRITETELIEKLHGEQVPPFEMISALLWQCLARIRSGREPELATICRAGTPAKNNEILHNKFRTSTIKLDSSAAGVGLLGLATRILKHDKDESRALEALVDRNSGEPADFLLYGANLTFVDMGGIDLYGLEIKRQRPVRVDYSVDGVGDEGAVLVLQPPDQRTDPSGSDQERSVMVILPEDEIPSLCQVLSSDFGIA